MDSTAKINFFISISIFLLSFFKPALSSDETNNNQTSPYTIHIAIIASNKAKHLPFTLTLIEEFLYQKKYLTISLHSDNNLDNTIQVLEKWRSRHMNDYKRILTYYNETKPANNVRPSWHDQDRHDRVLKIRQAGLDVARSLDSDFFIYIDADIYMTEKNFLNYMLETSEWAWVVKAPLLKSSKTYSNFWGAQADNGWYERGPDYEKVLNQYDENSEQEIKGLYYVPVIHSCIMIKLKSHSSMYLQFFPEMENYPFQDKDEVLVMNYNFKTALKDLGSSPVIDNRYIYGYIGLQNEDESEAADDRTRVHTLSEIMIEPPVGVDRIIKPISLPTKQVYPEQLENFGFDMIYCINLKRRPDRRNRMKETFRLHGIGPVLFPGAVDGHKLTQEYLDDNGIAPLAGFVDPYHKRTLTKGEIGCFLSHWRLWMHAVKHGYKNILILEDDLRFEYDFNRQFQRTLDNLNEAAPDWDLLYLGRKILAEPDFEIFPEGAYNFNIPEYSYWTLAYALSLKGAKKLMAQAPLDRLVPVDEYLPIMYNKHNRPELMEHFGPRDLKTYSSAPLLIFPTHYVGDINYFSDTEKSGLWETAKKFAPKGNDGTGFVDTDPKSEIGPSSQDKAKQENLGIDDDTINRDFERINFDQRFQTEEVLKNFEKWESDMAFLCDNDEELESAWAEDKRIFEKDEL